MRDTEPARPTHHAYFTATLDAAVWGAELARGAGGGRIYIVEPTGDFEDDPKATDKRLPGNPTRSFRSRAPLRIVGELTDWVGHPAEKLQALQDGFLVRQTGLLYAADGNAYAVSITSRPADGTFEGGQRLNTEVAEWLSEKVDRAPESLPCSGASLRPT